MSTHSMANIGGPHGDNVCIYRITDAGVEEISDDGIYTVFREGFNNTYVLESGSNVPLILKKCCPDYKADKSNKCIEARRGNPFAEPQFSYALIYLGLLLLVVGLLSIFVAYQYHYRLQRNKKHDLINNSLKKSDSANSENFRAVSMDKNKQSDTVSANKFV